MGLQVSEINFSSKIFNFSHIFNLDQDGVNITKKINSYKLCCPVFLTKIDQGRICASLNL